MEAGGALRSQRGLYSGDTGQVAGPLGLQGHIGRSSASSDCPSIRKESRDPGPTQDRATSPTSQGRRARLPPERHSAASSRSLPSLARSLALSPARSLARAPAPALRSLAARGSSSLVHRPRRCSSARATAGCASARSRCPDPTARIPLPEPRCTNPCLDLALGYRCLEPSVHISPSPWTALHDSSCPNPSAWTPPHGSLWLDQPHGSLCADPGSVATMPMARPQAVGPDRISLLLVAFLLGSPAAAQAEGKHPEGPGPKRVKLLRLARAVGVSAGPGTHAPPAGPPGFRAKRLIPAGARRRGRI